MQNLLSYNPGPTILSTETQTELQHLATSGLLSTSHRSVEFTQISKEAIEGLYKVMKIPKEYHIFYQPSATVAMDTILRNLVRKSSFHFIHGAFSKRFATTAEKLGIQTKYSESAWNDIPAWKEYSPSSETECVMLTQNETSTGLMWPTEVLQVIRSKVKDKLIAIDITSSFGSSIMDWSLGDAWFFSVQKCLGLPAGLGCIILSPRAFEKSKSAQGIATWQHFPSLAKKMETYQTVETPNVLGIALLAHRLKNFNPEKLEQKLSLHSKLWYESDLPWTPYITNQQWRSLTVLNFNVKNPSHWIEYGKTKGFLLGKGYGKLKDHCIRIANFPNFDEKIVKETIEFLHKIA